LNWRIRTTNTNLKQTARGIAMTNDELEEQNSVPWRKKRSCAVVLNKKQTTRNSAANTNQEFSQTCHRACDHFNSLFILSKDLSARIENLGWCTGRKCWNYL
jgi:hypothetical protein